MLFFASSYTPRSIKIRRVVYLRCFLFKICIIGIPRRQRSHHIGRLRLPSLCEMAEAFGKLACHVAARGARARSGPLHDRAHQGTELDRVQRLWRGQRVRSWIAALTSATIAVQRVHRGVVARKLAAARRAARARREARAIYHYHATLAQRTFRGFYSRRYRHDFRARRRYVEAVVATGEALRERLDQRRAARELDDQAADDARRAGALAAAARHLHHLVSTASAPGVYAAPVFDPRSAPTARGATMETHLRAGVRGALALSRRRYVEPPPSSAASLRAAAPFDAPRDAERLAARVARAGFVGACVEINRCVGCSVERQGTGIATPSSRRRVDGVEDDAMIQHERAVKF